MIAQALSVLLPVEMMAGETDRRFGYVQESVREYFVRIRDELLWPRILVRYAPPPDEVQPIAPDRF